MPLPRPCRICQKRFQPVSRSNKLCNDCYQKIKGSRMVRTKITLQNGFKQFIRVPKDGFKRCIYCDRQIGKTRKNFSGMCIYCRGQRRC